MGSFLDVEISKPTKLVDVLMRFLKLEALAKRWVLDLMVLYLSRVAQIMSLQTQRNYRRMIQRVVNRLDRPGRILIIVRVDKRQLRFAEAGAPQALVPLVEGAAESAGRYVAGHAPELVRDHVVPQFIDAFEKAN